MSYEHFYLTIEIWNVPYFNILEFLALCLQPTAGKMLIHLAHTDVCNLSTPFVEGDQYIELRIKLDICCKRTVNA